MCVLQTFKYVCMLDVWIRVYIRRLNMCVCQCVLRVVGVWTRKIGRMYMHTCWLIRTSSVHGCVARIDVYVCFCGGAWKASYQHIGLQEHAISMA
jgi:hypothetical protein